LSDNDAPASPVLWPHEINGQKGNTMQNMRYKAALAAFALCVGIVALTLTANPLVALLGKFAIAASLIASATTAVTYVMAQSFAAHALRNEDFHWY
jgi:hypothetical protein